MRVNAHGPIVENANQLVPYVISTTAQIKWTSRIEGELVGSRGQGLRRITTSHRRAIRDERVESRLTVMPLQSMRRCMGGAQLSIRAQLSKVICFDACGRTFGRAK